MRAYVFGGTAMVLGFASRDSTHDVDARYAPTTTVQAAVDEVAARLSLPRSWLNEQATAYLPVAEDTRRTVFYDRPSLRIELASPQHLLAMKTDAGRPQDADDIRTLAAHLRLATVAQVVAVHDEVLPDEPLGPRKIRRIAEALAPLPPD